MSAAEPLPVKPGSSSARSPRGQGTRKTEPGRARGFLSLVPPPVRARRAPFVALVLTLLAGGLVGLLLLNTASAQEAFKLHALQSQEAELELQRQAHSSSDGGLDNPATLYKRAAALGLVPGGPPIFLKPGQPLPKGAIRVGNMAYIPAPVPVAPPPVPTPAASSSTPTPKASMSPAAKKSPAARKPAARKSTAPKATPSAPTTAKKPVTQRTPVARKSSAPTHTVAPKPTTVGRAPTTARTNAVPQTQATTGTR